MSTQDIKNGSVDTAAIKPPLKCTAFVLGRLCGTELEGKGHANSGYCLNCFYPTIVEDYERYREFRKEGMSREDAAAAAGIDIHQISVGQPQSKIEVRGTYGHRNVSKYNQLELQREQQLVDGASIQVKPEKSAFDIPVFMAIKQ